MFEVMRKSLTAGLRRPTERPVVGDRGRDRRRRCTKALEVLRLLLDEPRQEASASSAGLQHDRTGCAPRVVCLGASRDVMTTLGVRHARAPRRVA